MNTQIFRDRSKEKEQRHDEWRRSLDENSGLTKRKGGGSVEEKKEASQERTQDKTQDITKSQEPQIVTGKEKDEAFKAATHGVDEAPHEHPAHVEHGKEPTGRRADESWKGKH